MNDLIQAKRELDALRQYANSLQYRNCFKSNAKTIFTIIENKLREIEALVKISELVEAKS